MCILPFSNGIRLYKKNCMSFWLDFHKVVLVTSANRKNPFELARAIAYVLIFNLIR